MAWYRTGTVTVANGSPNVLGILTGWGSQVYPEDRFSVNGSKWYEILSVTDNTHIVLASNFAEATVTGGTYMIDRSGRGWHQISNLAAQVAALLATFPALGGIGDTNAFMRADAAGTAYEYTSIDDTKTDLGLATTSIAGKLVRYTNGTGTIAQTNALYELSSRLGVNNNNPQKVLDIYDAPSDTAGNGSVGYSYLAGSPLFVNRLTATGFDMVIDKSSGGVWAQVLYLSRATANVGIGVTAIGAPTHRLTVEGITAPNTDNAYTLGASGKRWSVVWAATGTINTSDERDKEVVSVIDSSAALNVLATIEPFTFRWKEGSNDTEEYDEEYDGEEQLKQPVTRVVSEIKVEGGVAKQILRNETYMEDVYDQYPLVTSTGLPVKDEFGNPIIHRVPRMVPAKLKRRALRVTSRPGNRVHAGVSAQKVRDALDSNGLICGAWGLDNKDDPDSRQHLRPDQMMWILWSANRKMLDEIKDLKARVQVLETMGTP